MLSSTSNSNERLPPGPWILIWGATLAIAVVVLGSYEVFCRSRGFIPSITDDAAHWAYVRGKIVEDDPAQVVFLGASRIKLAIDIDAFHKTFGGPEPVQLAAEGSVCLPVLEHLSRDEAFRGVVVCDLNPGILSRKPHLSSWTHQAGLVKAYQQQGADADFEQSLRLMVQKHVVIKRPDLSLKSVASTIVDTKKFPKPGKVILPNRSGLVEFQKRTDGKGGTGGRFEPDRWADAKVIQQMLSELEPWVERIQARGGQVVFVRMPASGAQLVLENEEFPRAEEWDVLAKCTAAKTIHFEDFTELAHFQCPDGGHLDRRDAPEFSVELAKILKNTLSGGPHGDLQNKDAKSANAQGDNPF